MPLLRCFRLVIVLTGIALGLSAAEPLNLSVAKDAVLRYVADGDYQHDLTVVADQACAWLKERAPRKSADEKLALVLDVDETALSNLAHMQGLDFGYVPREWDAWVEEGGAPAIEPVLRIFKTARELGVSVIFITGRRESDRPGTEKNLVAAGFGDYQALICLPAGQAGNSEQFKTAARRRLEQAGWTIIANVGDQASDLDGGSAEKTFKLPNPFYLTP